MHMQCTHERTRHALTLTACHCSRSTPTRSGYNRSRHPRLSHTSLGGWETRRRARQQRCRQHATANKNTSRAVSLRCGLATPQEAAPGMCANKVYSQQQNKVYSQRKPDTCIQISEATTRGTWQECCLPSCALATRAAQHTDTTAQQAGAACCVEQPMRPVNATTPTLQNKSVKRPFQGRQQLWEACRSWMDGCGGLPSVMQDDQTVCLCVLHAVCIPDRTSHLRTANQPLMHATHVTHTKV
jgi:hypothetical protein